MTGRWVIIHTDDLTVTGMFPTMVKAEGWAYDTYGNTGWAVRQASSPPVSSLQRQYDVAVRRNPPSMDRFSLAPPNRVRPAQPDDPLASVPGYHHEDDGTLCRTAARTGPADPVCECDCGPDCASSVMPFDAVCDCPAGTTSTDSSSARRTDAKGPSGPRPGGNR